MLAGGPVVRKCRAAVVIAPTVIAVTISSAAMAAPPQQLLGKSIIVTWSNTRQQRDQKPDGSWTEFRSVQGSHKLIIYISTAGRVFSRQVNTVGARSGTIDQVAGESGGPYAVRTSSFSGQTMTVIGAGQGGASRTQITFDSGFTSCTAQTMVGFEAGKTSVMLSPITKRKVETRSVEVGAVSCSMRSGNVLDGST
jgi:hypothetical protein